MPNFVKELTTCSDIGSCFQMIYNLLLTLLVVLAFMYGVYGALEYLFSAASVTKQESGKNKIINAIGAILVAFILPSVLNIINPNIFRVKWVFPRIERASPPGVVIKYEAGFLPGSDNSALDQYFPDFKPDPEKCRPIENNASYCDWRGLVSYFENEQDAKKASVICKAESGENPQRESGIDKCQDGYAFSIGLFQINMTATEFSLDDGTKCIPTEIFNFAGNSPRFNYDSKKYECTVKKRDLYNKCKEALKNPNLNLRLARLKYKASGFAPWSAWETSQKCGLCLCFNGCKRCPRQANLFKNILGNFLNSTNFLFSLIKFNKNEE